MHGDMMMTAEIRWDRFRITYHQTRHLN